MTPVLVDGEVTDLRYVGKGEWLLVRRAETLFGVRLQLGSYTVSDGFKVLDNFTAESEVPDLRTVL